jgi:hypothetical protein
MVWEGSGCGLFECTNPEFVSRERISAFTARIDLGLLPNTNPTKCLTDGHQGNIEVTDVKMIV